MWRKIKRKMKMKMVVMMMMTMVIVFTMGDDQKFSATFYDATCPKMESIVLQVVSLKLNISGPIVAASTLRLFFHDCFVQGCDGSVLLSSTPGNVAERDAKPNLSLGGDGFDVIVRAKQAVEQECPGVVSCADILAVAARDFVVLSGGPSWSVKKGRRDGRLSTASQALANLPEANFTVGELVKSFNSKGLGLIDMIALSGAHTIGFSHCDQFTPRLYNFSSRIPTDPSFDPGFANALKKSCPIRDDNNANVNTVEPFDAATPFLFDNFYYKNLIRGRGLIASDQVLFNDLRSRKYVTRFAKKHLTFFDAFTHAIDKMGSIQLKLGSEGEIRKICTSVN